MAPHGIVIQGETAVFRILTEDKNIEGIKATLCGLDLDFTLFRGTGSWQRKEEPSLAVEIDIASREVAERVAWAIKTLNNQEAVLLQEFVVFSELI